MRDIDLLVVGQEAPELAVNEAMTSRALRETARLTRVARRARAVPQVHGGQLPLWATGPRQRSPLALMMRPADAFAAVADGSRHHDVPGAGAPRRHPLRALPGAALRS